jgi:hypothetical protein
MNHKSTDTPSVSAEEKLAKIILAGLSSRRSDEEWEHFVNRTIEMFRQKNLLKRETPTHHKIMTNKHPKTEKINHGGHRDHRGGEMKWEQSRSPSNWVCIAFTPLPFPPCALCPLWSIH